ncbi:phage terminase large subunit [Cryobacterium sp. GrIS_2_6]|uniref:phage terminase large subunit n=1 Tax=Cryobacterium sp. GrIS_2_6 TaxID=3162785 RepID=UPI002E0665B8|nr:putative phage terminase large subunit-like protein [Cryobacterium psychrotolerans]
MALPNPSELIQQLGEDQAKLVYRTYYRDPAHIEEFAELFSSYVPTKLAGFHSELFDYFEDDGNVGIAAPRGFSKTTVTDTIYLAHRLLYARSHFAMLISDTYTQAVMMIDGLKSELESNEVLLWIYGDVKGREWSSEGLTINAYGENGRELVRVLPRGAGMKVRGLRYKQYRPDLAILDDLENDELVASPERREKLYNWFMRALMPAMAKDISKIIIIGTILHRESLLSHIIAKKGVFSGWKTHKYQGITSEGESLWPERFSLEYLQGMRDDPEHPMYLGVVEFSREIQNDPISDQDQIIRPEWLQSRYSFMKSISEYQSVIKAKTLQNARDEWLRAHFSKIVGHIDPAISEKTTADWWAMITIGITKACPFCEGHPRNHVVILDYVRLRESDPEKQANMIGDQFQTWRHDRLKIEAVAYQAGLYALTRNIAQRNGINMPIVKWKPDRDKVRRASMQAGMFQAGYVHLREDHPLASAFVEEIVQFPQGEHDDMFDAYLGAAEELVLQSRRRVFTNKPKGF